MGTKESVLIAITIAASPGIISGISNSSAQVLKTIAAHSRTLTQVEESTEQNSLTELSGQRRYKKK
ncbi:MAG: hypothetical protein KDD40_08490 [Bdellovibrionales bacterium]|nr:hypothetical protein [Bdellovibrionales bacterium]